MFVVDGDKRGARNLPPQQFMASRRDPVDIRHEQDDWRHVAPRRFLDEADLLAHLEEFVEHVKAEIDDLGFSIVDDQPVHQLHLAVGVVDLRRLGEPRQVIEQRRLLQVEIEGSYRSIFQQQEFTQQPRNHRLADERARGADDIDRRETH